MTCFDAYISSAVFLRERGSRLHLLLTESDHVRSKVVDARDIVMLTRCLSAYSQCAEI